jgi:hypothetical protein
MREIKGLPKVNYLGPESLTVCCFSPAKVCAAIPFAKGRNVRP